MGSLIESLNTPVTRQYLEAGTGIAIAVGSRDLRVVITRVRFGRLEILAAATLENFRERPAAQWGAEFDALVRRAGVPHLSATILLPRREVIVRRMEFPGVADADLANALAFEVDALHPWEEDQAAWGYAKLPRSQTVLVGLMHRDSLDRYVTLFTESGIRIASFTFSAAALYSALRFRRAPLPGAFLSAGGFDDQGELYGESAHYPVFSAAMTAQPERSVTMALAELRLDPEEPVLSFADLLPVPRKSAEGFRLDDDALPYATSLLAACPWLGASANLLPRQFRVETSRTRYVPTAVLVLLLAGGLTSWGVQSRIAERRYAEMLNAEIARLQPEVQKTIELEQQIEEARKRVELVDTFSRRVPADLQILADLSALLEAPAWVNVLEMDRESVNVTGQAPRAAGLLKVLDDSPRFHNSEFSLPISRRQGEEAFRIRTIREEGK